MEESEECERIAAERQQKIIPVKFVDRQTGADIIASHKLDSTQIKVSNMAGGPAQLSWKIYNISPNSPLNGTLLLYIEPTRAGDFNHQIAINNFGSATLAFTIEEYKNTKPCGPAVYYNVSNIRIVDRPSRPYEFDGRTIPDIFTIEL